jgi:hypothetical protein
MHAVYMKLPRPLPGRVVMGRASAALSAFLRDRSGNTLIVGALSLPVVLGVGALTLEYGNGVLTKVSNQRIADLASYSGAIAYAATENEASMTAAARSMAALNGIDPAGVSVTLVDSPRTAGAKAVGVTVETQQTLLLSRFVSDRASLSISSAAFAEVGLAQNGVPNCILALAGTGGITLSGGVKINGPDCTVSSNAGVSVPCGTEIRTVTLKYDSLLAPYQPCAGIMTGGGTPAPLVKVSTPDPLAGNEAIATAVARIATVNALAAPTPPTAGQNKDINFGWNVGQTQTQASQIGCSASWNAGQSKWTLTCAGTPVRLRNMTVEGGINVDFNLAGAANVTYNFKGSISNNGAVVRFSGGTFTVAQGISTGGGSTTSFGAGTFRIGRQTGQCAWQNQYYSICNTSSLTFAGPSRFELHSGVYNTQQLTLGAGGTNSYKIGPSSTGFAFNTGGGSTTLLYDVSGANRVFQAKGNVLTGGGSCLKLPSVTNADLDGNISVAGALILGAGVWTVDGYLALGENGGGGAACDGATVSLKATGVSLVLSGSATPGSGNCAGQVFCVANGYSNILLTAPMAGTMAGLAVIGPQPAANTSGVSWMGGGSGGQIAGAFYFPNAHLQMTGGASMGGAPGGCLQIVAARITLSGGTAAASECIDSGAGSGGPTSTNVSLVK